MQFVMSIVTSRPPLRRYVIDVVEYQYSQILQEICMCTHTYVVHHRLREVELVIGECRILWPCIMVHYITSARPGARSVAFIQLFLLSKISQYIVFLVI